MKLFLDQDVYAMTAQFLREAGHDVVTAAEAGLSRAEDVVLMSHARKSGRILITRDRDFGHLALLTDVMPGILYLRVHPSSLAVIHDELARVLERYDEAQLKTAFIVIEPGRHRIRRPLNSL